jgi:hypothetical protein
MKYKIEFQYKGENDERPDDVIQDERIIFENGEYIPIPNVGDSVEYKYNGTEQDFLVVSRHFSYTMGWCVVNIVVTDISEEEMAKRIKM